MQRKANNSWFDLRQLVIFHYEKCKSYRQIGKMVNLSNSTVGNIIKRYLSKDRIEPIAQKGRPQLLTEHDKRWIMRKV